MFILACVVAASLPHKTENNLDDMPVILFAALRPFIEPKVHINEPIWYGYIFFLML